jgi:anti-sigma factor RsiW
MKPEHLESLLLDRALGELSPAVAELLEAHLALDPVAARRAAELGTTVQLARRAVAPPISGHPRPLDVAQLRRAERATQVIALRTEGYRLAACLALGLGLGWFARPITSVADSSAPLAPASTFAVTASPEPRSTFWSVARLAASQRRPANHPLSARP